MYATNLCFSNVEALLEYDIDLVEFNVSYEVRDRNYTMIKTLIAILYLIQNLNMPLWINIMIILFLSIM